MSYSTLREGESVLAQLRNCRVVDISTINHSGQVLLEMTEGGYDYYTAVLSKICVDHLIKELQELRQSMGD